MSDGLQALSAPMRPAEALSSSGLGQLVNLVTPLQSVLDRLAGNASAVHSFVEAWTSVSQRITQIQQQLGQSVATGTAQWQGSSADAYRQRADASPANPDHPIHRDVPAISADATGPRVSGPLPALLLVGGRFAR